MMQSAGSISVGTLLGPTCTDKFKLDANGEGGIYRIITSDSIIPNSITVNGYIAIANAAFISSWNNFNLKGPVDKVG